MIKIYGAYLSPFVRKVVLTMELKGIEFEMINAAPGMFPEGYEEKHPLKKIPTYESDEVSIPDSTAICQYLDDKFPGTNIIPKNPEQKATALWLEEFSDTKLAETCGGALFFQRFMKPLMGKQPDEEMVEANLKGTMKDALGYLEGISAQRTGKYLVGEQLSIADIAVCCQFMNAKYVGYEVDAAEFPQFRAYFDGICAEPLFTARMAHEEKLLAMLRK